jgi:predicted component of type VI protein secretion system
MVFNLIVYCQADVQSTQLRKAILQEIREILNALVESKKMIDEAMLPEAPAVSEQQLQTYMRLKRKKLNYKMLILTDCIALEEPLPEGLLDFVQKMSEVYEVRGVAYKDL